MSEMGHVWTAPAVQEESDYYQRSVRVRSCIRPLNAAVWPPLHELVTNAATPDGRVLVSWDCRSSEDAAVSLLLLVWQERGGPSVAANASASSYGKRAVASFPLGTI